MNDLNINEITASVVTDLCSSMLKGAKDIGRETLAKLEVNLGVCLPKYLERSYERYSKTKTLLYRERPVSIKNFYVRTDLVLEFRTISEQDFLTQIKTNKRIIVSGTAGSGKSTFCKSIFIEVLEKKMGVIPIFVELRHLNSESNRSLIDYVVSMLSDIEPSFDRQQLEYALSKGRFLLIFDGFDEINGDRRFVYEKEIIELSNKYHKILILISSRPDSRFSSWEEFYRYGVKPLTKKKALNLIGQLEYDQELKDKFLIALDENLYEDHESFSSNPLLLTMMLLTYEQIAEIPNKIHLFYEQAFLTLFNKHDSLKSLYKRKSCSGLPLDEFKKVLSAFCVLGYAEKAYYFEEEKLFEYLHKAIRICGVSVDVNDFLSDLLDSVCIMQRDGLGFAFTHRSFQEYFTALFLVTNASAQKYEVFDKIFFVNTWDSVMSMAYDINSDIVEQVWIIPRLQNFIKDFTGLIDEEDGCIKLLRKMYCAICIMEDSIEDDEDGEGSNANIGLAYTFYKEGNDYASFFAVTHSIYGDEWLDFYRSGNQPSNKFDDELVDVILNDCHNQRISLVDIDGIPEHIKLLIVKAGCHDSVVRRIEFSRILLERLRLKHVAKSADISSLLLG
ncbi:NACHT domain-containing protein [Pseudomonas sp. OTU750018]|uniref:NACHT domain-containing protein n=1 Tax=Pseudomonas sp. OTU750018 TaxID=2709708 RepID=UPI00141DE6A6|nr:NACHT domain-containing protein [Pseudomonas sp. OTU750018]